MFITPIAPVQNLEALGAAKGAVPSQDQVALPFQSLLETAVDNVMQADGEVQQEAYKLAVGESDDLHNITIFSTKLSLATDLLIQLRNKTLDAYNEVMRMGV